MCLVHYGQAQEELSGPQSGTLTAGDYHVVENISVEWGETWLLSPGVNLLFFPGTGLEVDGVLHAFGEPEDSIRFSRYSPDDPWNGIHISGGFGGVRLEYSVVTGSDHCGVYGENNGHVYLYGCRISENTSVDTDDGGVRSQSAIIDTVWYTTISDNDGYGYSITLSQLNMRECVLKGNSDVSVNFDYGGGDIVKTSFTENLETAVKNHSAVLEIDSCIFADNSAYDGGAFRSAGGITIFNRCLFASNHASNNGGAIEMTSNFAVTHLLHCVMIDNYAESQGSAIYMRFMVISNCMFIDHAGEEAIYSFETGSPPRYCLFFNNEEDYQTETPGYPIGELSSVNFNGDSCDVYNNLFMNPLFLEDSDPPYQLSASSPAIDAGDTTHSELDPDLTLPDIGIHYYDQMNYVHDDPYSMLETSYSILEAWPNPFNSSINISWSSIRASNIMVRLFALDGRLIKSFNISKGGKNIQFLWDAPEYLSSGSYLVSITDGHITKSKRLLFIK